MAVALAGAAGASCRAVVDHVVSARAGRGFPWGTLAVNLSGGLLAGTLAAAVARGLPHGVGVVAGGGFCGAYTTFSTLAYDSWRLLEERAVARAAGNLATLALGGLAAAWGWALVAP